MCLRYSVGDIRPPRTRCLWGCQYCIVTWAGAGLPGAGLPRGWPSTGLAFQATYYACRTRVVEASQEQRPRAVQGALRRGRSAGATADRYMDGAGLPGNLLEQCRSNCRGAFIGRSHWKASPVEGQPRGRPAPWKASPAHKGVPRS